MGAWARNEAKTNRTCRNPGAVEAEALGAALQEVDTWRIRESGEGGRGKEWKVTV